MTRAMTDWRRGWAPGILGGLVVLTACGMWLYAVLVFLPIQNQRMLQGPYNSDFYFCWRGAYAVLWEGRDPYSPEVTADIQRGFYGPAVTSTGAPLPQTFAYPLTIVWLLAPLTLVPFAILRPALYVLLPLIVGATTWLWMRALSWQGPRAAAAVGAILVASAIPTVGGTLLQQPSILVAALLAGGVACLAIGHTAGAARPRWDALAGVLLAAATVKPQLAWALIGWLLAWAAWDLRRRWGLPVGFVATLGLLAGASWIALPGWVGEWLAQVNQYPTYAFAGLPLEAILPAWVARPLLAALAGLLVVLAWRSRALEPPDRGWRVLVVLTMAFVLLVFPGWAAYNQVILVPAALFLVQERTWLRAQGAVGRNLFGLVVGLLLWPLLAANLALLAWAASQVTGGGVPPDLAATLSGLAWVPSLLVPVVLVIPALWLGFGRPAR